MYIITTCRCPKCKGEINRQYMNNGICVWCRRKESEEKVREALRASAQTHIGRIAQRV